MPSNIDLQKFLNEIAVQKGIYNNSAQALASKGVLEDRMVSGHYVPKINLAPVFAYLNSKQSLDDNYGQLQQAINQQNSQIEQTLGDAETAGAFSPVAQTPQQMEDPNYSSYGQRVKLAERLNQLGSPFGGQILSASKPPTTNPLNDYLRMLSATRADETAAYTRARNEKRDVTSDEHWRMSFEATQAQREATAAAQAQREAIAAYTRARNEKRDVTSDEHWRMSFEATQAQRDATLELARSNQGLLEQNREDTQSLARDKEQQDRIDKFTKESQGIDQLFGTVENLKNLYERAGTSEIPGLGALGTVQGLFDDNAKLNSSEYKELINSFIQTLSGLASSAQQDLRISQQELVDSLSDSTIFYKHLPTLIEKLNAKRNQVLNYLGPDTPERQALADKLSTRLKAPLSSVNEVATPKGKSVVKRLMDNPFPSPDEDTGNNVTDEQFQKLLQEGHIKLAPPK